MKRITVEVREDHLENLAQTKPILAMAELIWNALDAEATEVRVEFLENDLQGLEAIHVADNGHGLHYEDTFLVFRNLGGSWKRGG
ncbi:MAG TPA: ATP-binding protein, partial [Candidatus Hydrogenedentes bacterium]|nr:ATP-binding protein [Candidatus Hydrogenedentota bacterium]